MYSRRRRRRPITYIPRNIGSNWSHETTNIAVQLTENRDDSFIFPVDSETHVVGSVVIPSISAQGLRYIKNIRIKLTSYGHVNEVTALLIYCPSAINPQSIGQQDQMSLYEPNQNLILHTCHPINCYYIRNGQGAITGKQPLASTTQIAYSKATWKLASDDSIRIVFSSIGGCWSSDTHPLIFVGTVDYWVRF